MTSEKFKKQLKQEAQQWQKEGLIDASFYDQLTQRYQFDQLDIFAKNRFIMILIGVGSILLGLAVITFVAANWEIWTRDVKVFILLGFFIAINSGGFYLWKSVQEGWQHRLGLGLLLLGSMVLGSNIGLMSQLFHQSGPIYQLYLVWAIGVLGMAYSLRLTILGIVSVILLGIGYLCSLGHIYYYGQEPLLFQLIIEHFPLLLSISLIPLAYWRKSKWLFTLTLLLVIESYVNNLIIQADQVVGFSAVLTSFLTVSATCLPPAFLYAYQDQIWLKNVEYKLDFDVISRRFGILFMALLFYTCSFRGLWENEFIPKDVDLTWHNLLMLIEPVILFGLTILAWWYLGLPNHQDSSQMKKEAWRISLTSSIMGGMLILTAILISYHINIAPIGWWGIFFFNVLLALLSFGLIRESLGEAKRLGFWTGIIFIVLQIFTRMLEYDTDLLLKAFVFFLCGIGIIMAGLWFEKYIVSGASNN